MIKALRESYPFNFLCEEFSVHRSTYKYWVNRSRTINPERIKELALIKRAFHESNGSAGARSIAGIATTRDHPLTLYREPCRRMHPGEAF